MVPCRFSLVRECAHPLILPDRIVLIFGCNMFQALFFARRAVSIGCRSAAVHFVKPSNLQGCNASISNEKKSPKLGWVLKVIKNRKVMSHFVRQKATKQKHTYTGIGEESAAACVRNDLRFISVHGAVYLSFSRSMTRFQIFCANVTFVICKSSSA